MADLLPSSTDVDADSDAEPRVVGLDSDDADDLLSALSSTTARRVLAALHDDPDTPSALADRVDTSLQNVQYHLGNLEDAGLVEVAGTAYSEKGREMKVYAPADGPLVVVAGDDEEASGLRAALSRLIGGVGILGAASVVLDRLARGGLPLPSMGSSAGADGGAGGAGGGGGASGESGGAGAPSVENATRTTAEGGDGGATATPTAADLSGNADAGTTAARTTDAANGGGPSIAEATTTPTATPAPTDTATRTAADTTASSGATASPEATRTLTESAGDGLGSVDLAAASHAVASSPGLLFFLGGTAVLVGGFAYWYWRR